MRAQDWEATLPGTNPAAREVAASEQLQAALKLLERAKATNARAHGVEMKAAEERESGPEDPTTIHLAAAEGRASECAAILARDPNAVNTHILAEIAAPLVVLK